MLEEAMFFTLGMVTLDELGYEPGGAKLIVQFHKQIPFGNLESIQFV